MTPATKMPFAEKHMNPPLPCILIVRLSRKARLLLCALGLVGCCVATATENAAPPPSAPPQYSSAALETLVTPIALYADPLVAIILPASVYPLEVGDAAFQLAEANVVVDIPAQAWDPSVKSLAQFPTLVQWMDRNLPWTTEMGRAVVAQQKEVLEAIQRVRAKSYAAGTLKSDAYNSVTKATTTSGKEIITITPMAQPAGANPPTAAVATTATSVTNPPTTTEAAAPTYATAPVNSAPAYYPSTPPPPASGAASAVVGIAALAVVANNVDWDEKYVINTPGGIVIVDEDDLDNLHRPSQQPTTTATSSSASAAKAKSSAQISTQPVNRATPSTQPNRQPAPSAKNTTSVWQPNPSRLASSGAPQPSSASRNAAARGWARSSPAVAVSGPSEGGRARAYSGRGAASRAEGRSGR